MLKRVLQVVGGVLLLLFVVVGVGAYQTFGNVKPQMDGEEVGPGWSVVTGHVQAFVVQAGDGAVILIDAGMAPDAKDIVVALGKRGLAPSSVRAVLVTHGHPDHIGGIAAFPDAEVYAHRGEQALITGKTSGHAPARKVIPHAQRTARITGTLEDGQVLEIAGKQIEVLHVPGHTPGSVAYLIDGVLYLGDSATASKEGEAMRAPWFFSDDTAENEASLVRLADRVKSKDVRALVFSHSGALKDAQPLQRLAARLRR